MDHLEAVMASKDSNNMRTVLQAKSKTNVDNQYCLLLKFKDLIRNRNTLLLAKYKETNIIQMLNYLYKKGNNHKCITILYDAI